MRPSLPQPWLGLRIAVPADPGLDAAVQAVADPGRLPAVLAHEHHVRKIDEQFLLDDAALLECLAAPRPLASGSGVGGGPGHTFHHDPVLLRQDVDHPAALAAVLSPDDLNLVVLSNVDWHVQSTSGASEMIFMNLF